MHRVPPNSDMHWLGWWMYVCFLHATLIVSLSYDKVIERNNVLQMGYMELLHTSVRPIHLTSKPNPYKFVVNFYRITWTRLIWSIWKLISVMNKVIIIASGMHTISRLFVWDEWMRGTLVCHDSHLPFKRRVQIRIDGTQCLSHVAIGK